MPIQSEVDCQNGSVHADQLQVPPRVSPLAKVYGMTYGKVTDTLTRRSQNTATASQVRQGVLTIGTVLRSKRKISDRLLSVLNEFKEEFGYIDIYKVPLDDFYEQKLILMRILAELDASEVEKNRNRASVKLFFWRASQLGWRPDQSLSDDWRRILPDAEAKSCSYLVRYFARMSFEPKTLTRQHVDEWINQSVIRRHRTFQSAASMASDFTTILLQSGFTNVNPVAWGRLESYGVRFDAIESDTLRREIDDLITYRTNDADGSDELDQGDEDEADEIDEKGDLPDPTLTRNQLRQVSGDLLRAGLCRVYGFLYNVKRRQDVSHLDQLYEKKVLRRYRRYLLGREVSIYGLHHVFDRLIAAGLQYPELSSRHIFLKNFSRQLLREPAWLQRQRMAEKTLPHEVLQTIPDQFRDERVKLETKICSPEEKKRIDRDLFRLALKEFLLRWILVLPWRARNICEIQLVDPSTQRDDSRADLYEHDVLPYSDLAEDAEVKAAVTMGAKRTFWQYEFSKDRCKANAPIHRLLPKELVEHLGVYLKFRKEIAGEYGPLFVNAKGLELTTNNLYCLICEITLQGGKKRASTKVLRDVFAFHFLMTHPDDNRYSQLARELWHSDVQTTQRYYATQMNLSAGSPLLDKASKDRAAREVNRIRVVFNAVDRTGYVPLIGAAIVYVLLWYGLFRSDLQHTVSSWKEVYRWLTT